MDALCVSCACRRSLIPILCGRLGTPCGLALRPFDVLLVHYRVGARCAPPHLCVVCVAHTNALLAQRASIGSARLHYYAIGFSVLAILRVLAVFAVGIANAGTLSANPILLYCVAIVLLLPMLYLFYSVQKYFGFAHAYGIDHFDESYRAKPLVREGIFKYTDNGMYTFGTLIVILPGLIFASKAALLLGVLNYLYVWVHYFALEKPDMKRIYDWDRG